MCNPQLELTLPPRALIWSIAFSICRRPSIPRRIGLTNSQPFRVVSSGRMLLSRSARQPVGNQGTWQPPWYGPIGVVSFPGSVVSNSIPKAISLAFIVRFLSGSRCVLGPVFWVAMTHMSHAWRRTSSELLHVCLGNMHVFSGQHGGHTLRVKREKTCHAPAGESACFSPQFATVGPTMRRC